MADGETHCADTRKGNCWPGKLAPLIEAWIRANVCLKPEARRHCHQTAHLPASKIWRKSTCLLGQVQAGKTACAQLRAPLQCTAWQSEAARDPARACCPAHGRRSYAYSKPPSHLGCLRSHLRVNTISPLVWVCRLWWTS